MTTQPQANRLLLPAPEYPMLTRVISNPLFPPENGAKDEPITWTYNAPHPLVGKSMTVVRMFRVDDGIDIYSLSSDGTTGMRNNLPTHMIRFVEEGMPIPTFVEELTAAESGSPSDENEEEEGEEEETDPGEALPPAQNSQDAPS